MPIFRYKKLKIKVMSKLVKLDKNEVQYGTHLVGHLSYGITYNDLVDAFGEPTFLPEDSGDGKVNFEWAFDFEDESGINEFTIYDWKTESAEWSKENTGTSEQAGEWFGSRWHVGGKGYGGDFIEYIEKKVGEKVVS